MHPLRQQTGKWDLHLQKATPTGTNRVKFKLQQSSQIFSSAAAIDNKAPPILVRRKGDLRIIPGRASPVLCRAGLSLPRPGPLAAIDVGVAAYAWGERSPGTVGGRRCGRGPAPDPARRLPLGQFAAGLLQQHARAEARFKEKFPNVLGRTSPRDGSCPGCAGGSRQLAK